MLSASLASRAQGVTQVLVPDWDKESTAQKGRNCPELNVVRLALEAEQVWLLESAVVTVHYGVSAAHTTFPGPRKDCSGVCQGSLLQDF